MARYKWELNDEGLRELRKIVPPFNLDEIAIGIHSKLGNWSNFYYEDQLKLIKEVYTLFVNTDHRTTDLARFYDVPQRNAQEIVKKFGINLDRFEAQRRASLKRDYKAIALKGRITKAKSLCGSNMEEYIRHFMYCELKLLSDYEVFVSVNSPKQLGKWEHDIPIIIIDGDKFKKYLVELEGEPWHKDDQGNRNLKEQEAIEHGYTVYHLEYKGYMNRNNVEDEARKIAKDIIKTFCE